MDEWKTVKLREKTYLKIIELKGNKGFDQLVNNAVNKYHRENEEITNLKLEVERLKGQQPQCQPEATTHVLAVRENSQEVWTPTEIIKPSDIQIVTVGNTEIRISPTQKEKVLWKDGHRIYSEQAAANLGFADAMGEVSEHHAKQLMQIRTDAIREIEMMKTEGCQIRAQIREERSVKDDNMQKTSPEKYDSSTRQHFCAHGNGLVYPSQCKSCVIECKYSPTLKPTSITVEQPQTQEVESECPFNNKDPDACLNCQREVRNGHQRHMKLPAYLLDCPKIKSVLA